MGKMPSRVPRIEAWATQMSLPSGAARGQLQGHGEEVADVAVELSVGPPGGLKDIGPGTAARRGGGILKDDVFLMVAADQLPACAALLFLDEAQHFQGPRAAIDHIAGDHDEVGTPGVDVSGNGLQSRQIAMNIGQDGEFHDQHLPMKKRPARARAA